MTHGVVSEAVLLLSAVTLGRTGSLGLGLSELLGGRRRTASTQAAVMRREQVLADAIELKRLLDAHAFATHQALQRVAAQHGSIAGDE